MGSTRLVAGIGVAVAIHVGVLLALPRSPPSPLPATPTEQRTVARAERLRLLRNAEADLAAKRTTFGELMIHLGALDARIENPDVDPGEEARAIAAYRAMLDDVRAHAAAGVNVPQAIAAAVAKDGRAARYKRMYPRLVDALAHGGGNCVALSTLTVALAHDAGHGDAATFRVYTNHVAPDVSGFQFGMTKRCHGPGDRRPGACAPRRVQLDVIDTLPCASESFVAQLDGLALPAARTLRAACEARTQAAQDPCDLGASLTRLRAHTASADRDLCEAVLVRQLATRCRGDGWRADARAWAEGKPALLTSRIAARQR